MNESNFILRKNKQVFFEFKNVNLKVPGKQILKNICGNVKPGEVLAIMGPSGSGKTSLLNALAGRINFGELEGEIKVNGKKPNRNKFKYYAKYVPQEDNLVGTVSVYDTIKFSAELNGQNNERKIDRLISDLGLAHIKDVNIGTIFKKGISGGEKRRVSIGIEMITEPELIFFDEPTSGLDSASAFYIMKLIKQFAEQGRTIICSIHQPSSQIFNMLDKILLLSHGSPVYNGKREHIIEYFDNLGHKCPQYVNPADYFLELINDNFEDSNVDYLISQFHCDNNGDVIEYNVDFENEVEEKKVSIFKQFNLLMRRMAIDNIKNPGVIWVRVLMYIMISLMIGGMYFDIDNDQDTVFERISILFYIVAFMVFMSIAVVPAFIIERGIFERETRNGWYSIGAYSIASFIMQLPTVFLLSVFSTTIVFSMVQMNGEEWRWLLYFLTLFMSLFVAENFMTLISVSVPYYIIGMAIGAGAYGFFMLCSGFFILPSNIPDWFIWGYWSAFHSYAFELFMWTEFDSLELKCDPNRACLYPNGKAVLDYYEMNLSEKRRIMDYLILLGFAILFRFLAYLILKYKMHKLQRKN